MVNDNRQYIKGYELHERIAAGGFGAVYRAKQSTIGREVAIKVILPGLANQPDFIRRFEAEAQMIARLEHMNIVPLYDYWRDPDGAYLVMRYLRGGSLRGHIKRQGSLEVEETFNLLSQIAQGLHIAHRNQIIHRDIKPGNILLDEDGNAYVGDFGIAKDQAEADIVTDADNLVGSPEYIAPEQARSEPVTPQTDIYSLGVVLYEMLAGEHPFESVDRITYIFKHLNDPLPEILTLDDSVRNDINDVIQKATAKDPRQRFGDVIEMMEALRDASKLGTTPTPVSVVELLTPREQEVMQLIIDGKTNREIADILVLTEGTVKQYINSIYGKLNVRSRVQAIARAKNLDFVIKKPDVPAINTDLLPEPQNPYKGLQAFQASDNRNYFGREKLVHKLVRRLQEDAEYQRFLAIVGPSGSGKSSVVKAGLIPALWQGDYPGSENWYTVELLPGNHPLDELEVALFQIATEKSLNLREQLTRDERGLVRVANMILPDENSELLIIIDQFEEIFTLLQDEVERLQFLKLLRSAVTESRSKVRVVVTLRADYYDRPLQYADVADLVRDRVETVLPLSAEELERAIREPASQQGVKFQEGLVSRIVSDVHYQPGALPLLQYALTELFERRDNRILTLQAYQDIGGTGGALANRADELFLEGDDTRRNLIQQMFLRLVTLGEGAEDTRRRADRSELLEIADQPEIMDEIIDLYAQSRLLSLDHDPSTRQPTVEVAHEAILREWDRLRAWLNESREDIRQEREIAQNAQKWQDNNRDKSYLLSGARLEQAEVWQSATEIALTPLESEYIRQSIARREADNQAEAERQARENSLEARARTVLRILVAVFAIAALMGGILALVANNERVRAEDTEFEALRQASMGLAAQVRLEVVEGVPDRAVPLALEAIENYPYTWQAERALFAGVAETQTEMRFQDISHTYFAEWTPDETRIIGHGLAIINDLPVLQIPVWDANTGELVRIRELQNPETQSSTSFSISPDGKYFATTEDSTLYIETIDTGDTIFSTAVDGVLYSKATWASDSKRIIIGDVEGNIQVWDIETSEMLQSMQHTVFDEWAIQKFLINSWLNGNERFVSTYEKRGIVWDVETGEIIHELLGHTGNITEGRLSPDRTRLLTLGFDNIGIVWDVENGEELFRISGEGIGNFKHGTWSPDGTKFLTIERGIGEVSEGVATVWDAVTGESIYRFIPEGGALTGAWSHDGKYIAVPDANNVIRIWNTETGDLTDLVNYTGMLQGYGRVELFWSQKDDRLLLPSWGVGVHVFDIDGVSTESMRGQKAILARWSPTDSRFLGTDSQGNLTIYDGESRDILLNLAELKDIYDAEWSPDGTMIAVNSGTKEIQIWDSATGELLNSWQTETDDGDDIYYIPSWSPDSKRLALRDQTTAILIYNITGELVTSIPNERMGGTTAVYWSPDGTRIAGGYGDGYVKVFDVESGELIQNIFVNGYAGMIAWSPDSSTLIAPMNYGGVVHVIDAESGEFLQTYSGNSGAITHAEWSRDGELAVSTGNVVNIWKPETSETIGTFDIRAARAGWSYDDTQLMISSYDDRLYFSKIFEDVDQLVAYAKECCVFRELTPEERIQFGLPTE